MQYNSDKPVQPEGKIVEQLDTELRDMCLIWQDKLFKICKCRCCSTLLQTATTVRSERRERVWTLEGGSEKQKMTRMTDKKRQTVKERDSRWEIWKVRKTKDRQTDRHSQWWRIKQRPTHADVYCGLQGVSAPFNQSTNQSPLTPTAGPSVSHSEHCHESRTEYVC